MKREFKSLFIVIFLILCGFAFTYLSIAFVQLDINFANWESEDRGFAILMSPIIAILIVGLYELIKMGLKECEE